MEDNLGLIVLDSMKEFGKEVQKELNKLRKNDTDYIIPVNVSRFSNGEAKVSISKTVRNKNIYILADKGNYDITYDMYGFTNHMSPDDHFQDIKRVILAICGHAEKISVVMPFLYEARQHRKKGRESLDCAYALQELVNMGVSEIITFDVHDPNIGNAVPLLAFDNFYATNNILEKFVKENNDDFDNTLIVSPDFGAMERARYFAEMLTCDVGVFYKRRDLSRVVNGKNPVVEHVYMGADIKGKNIIVVDDMIASGGSMIEVAQMLREKGAKKIYLTATFCMFTEGTDMFDKAFEDGLFDKLYTTNLTYIRKNICDKPWIEIVDCADEVADVINRLYSGKSISPLLENKTKTFRKIENMTK